MKFHISHESEGGKRSVLCKGVGSYIFTSLQIFVCYSLVEMTTDKYCKFVLHWKWGKDHIIIYFVVLLMNFIFLMRVRGGAVCAVQGSRVIYIHKCSNICMLLICMNVYRPVLEG